MDKIIIEKGQSASKFLQFSPGDDHIYIIIEDDATLNATLLINMPAATAHTLRLEVEQHARSRFNLVDVTLKTGTATADLYVSLVGQGASAALAGAVIADGEQTVEKRVLVEHVATGCTSDMLYKQVLSGKSCGLVHGKVLVRPDAQQSASEQTLANLCTSPDARALAQPMLEIYADDVKCNHGATTGKLDEAALLYMRQRGIPEIEARLLLQHAFVNDVLSRIPSDELRERLSHLVEHRFRGELKACNGCSLCEDPLRPTAAEG